MTNRSDIRSFITKELINLIPNKIENESTYNEIQDKMLSKINNILKPLITNALEEEDCEYEKSVSLKKYMNDNNIDLVHDKKNTYFMTYDVAEILVLLSNNKILYKDTKPRRKYRKIVFQLTNILNYYLVQIVNDITSEVKEQVRSITIEL